MTRGDRLDKLSNILSKVPVVNRFELDKVVKLIKAIWIEPLIVGILVGMTLGMIEYYNNPTKRLANILLIASVFLVLFVVFYILKAIYIARAKEETERYKMAKNAEGDRNDLIQQVLQHQEGLRVEWFRTWQEQMKFKLALQYDSIKEIKEDDKFDSEMKLYLIFKIIDKSGENFETLDTLMPQLTNDFEHFIIGHNKAPPIAQITAREYIRKLIEKIDDIE